MGQGHQIFAIARINGTYRSLAAIYHQGLLGCTVLKRCRDILNIFSSPNNRPLLRAELDIAAKMAITDWAENPETDAPFPFITHCLILGAGFSPKDGYYHTTVTEPWYIPFNRGNNSDGITIIDVTSPNKPRYCFADWHQEEAERNYKPMAVLPAHAYLEGYDTEANQPPDASDVISALSKFALIDPGTLHSIWPSGKWHSIPEEHIKSPEHYAEPGSDGSLSDVCTSTLQQLAFNTMMNELFADANQELNAKVLLSSFEHMSHLRTWITQSIRKQRDWPQKLKLTANLLEFAFEGATQIDLSEFSQLQADDVVGIIKSASESLHWLNVSRLECISDSNVARIAQTAPELRTLIIYGTGCSLKAVVESFKTSKLNQLHHDEQFHHFFLQPRLLPGARSARKYAEYDKDFPRIHTGSYKISQIIFKDCTDKEGSRSALYRALPLDEMDLSPNNLLSGSIRLAELLSSYNDLFSDLTSVTAFGPLIAMSFATSLGMINQDLSGVGPLARLIYQSGHTIYHCNDARVMQDGETALIVQRVGHSLPKESQEKHASVELRAGKCKIADIYVAFVTCHRPDAGGKGNEIMAETLAGDAMIMDVDEWIASTQCAGRLDQTIIQVFKEQLAPLDKGAVLEILEELSPDMIPEFNFPTF